MSSLLLRLGHWEVRRAAHSLRPNARRPTKNEPVCVECRADFRQALRQSRSYGDAFRSSVPETGKGRRGEEPDYSPASPRQAQYRRTAHQREIHGQTAGLNESAAYDPNAGFAEPPSPSPPYPAQDARPSARADRAARESDPENSSPLKEADPVDLWEFFERNDGEGEGEGEEGNIAIDREAKHDVPVDAGSQDAFLPKETDKMLDIDYKVELPFAMLKREPDMVIRCLFAAVQVNDREFLRDIPATTFSEIIRVLEPRNFMSPLASAHLELSAAMVAHFGIAPMREVAYEYVSVLKEVVSMRRGIPLTLSDFKALLRSARDLGHQKFALMLWNVLWAEGNTPDTKCYNLYMSSAVWNGVHSAGGRHKIRVIDFNMLARKKERLAPNFRQFRVGPRGVRETAMGIFNEMLANGAVANEESFRILITAASREGDIATVKSILKKVWSIDVDALIAGEDESTILPRPLPTHSPLHPTPQLLFAIAQTFGINNDIPSALRVVDFVARHYQLPITQAVWSQLFEWTFVLAIRRSGSHKRTGSKTNQLPYESVMSLWETMTSAPYHVQPTMGMYNFLIKNLSQRAEAPKMMDKMREGQKLYFHHRRRARALWITLQKDTGGEHEKLRHKYEAADLVRKRDLFWLKRWLRLLLASCRHRGFHRVEHRGGQVYVEEVQLATGEIPAVLWEWREYAPTVVRYEVPTGFVEFAIRTREEMESNARGRLEHRSKLRRGLKSAERYVGERWTIGDVHLAKRLRARE